MPAHPALKMPAWMPPAGGGPQVLPCGRDFDAIRLPAFTALHVLGRLPAPTPLIEDQTQDVAYWLVPAGTATRWLVQGTEALGAGTRVAIPAPDCCPGPWLSGPPVRWLVPPHGHCLTAPEVLRGVLTAIGSAVRRG